MNESHGFRPNLDQKLQKAPEEHRTNFASTKKLHKPHMDPRSAFSQKGISDREKEQLFLKFYDVNLKLKENDTKLEGHIKE